MATEPYFIYGSVRVRLAMEEKCPNNRHSQDRFVPSAPKGMYSRDAHDPDEASFQEQKLPKPVVLRAL